jgi:hypothetical protein
LGVIEKEARPGLAVIAPANGPVIVSSAAFHADMLISGFHLNSVAR